MVGREGFEPSKAKPADLQSAPFDRFGISPKSRAGGRGRTDDLLITNQLLYQLSYSSNPMLYPRHKASAGPSKKRADGLWTGPPRFLAEAELLQQF